MEFEKQRLSVESYQNNINNKYAPPRPLPPAVIPPSSTTVMAYPSSIIQPAQLESPSPTTMVYPPSSLPPAQLGSLSPTTMAASPVTIVVSHSDKSIIDAYLLGFPPLGFLGCHNFYLRRTGWGVLYLLTFGLLGCGWVIDYLRMPLLVKRQNKKMREGTMSDGQKYTDDAYVAWLPFGLFGKFAHLFHNLQV